MNATYIITNQNNPEDPETHWHAAVLVKKGQHCYVESSIFDPLDFTGIQGLEIQPQISFPQELSLIAVPLGWMKHIKSPYRSIRGAGHNTVALQFVSFTYDTTIR